MKKIILYDVKIDVILGIVRELRQAGLKQGTDFDFKYMPEKVADLFQTGGQFEGIVRRRSTEFLFHTDSMATWFALKYAEYAV